jgi:glyoxylase I family protein
MATIEHFAIFAADLERLKDFYVEALGLTVIIDNSRAKVRGYFLKGERGSALEIIARPEDVAGVSTRYVCHTAFAVEDVAAVKAALERRGVRFETDTAVDTEDFRTVFFNDPEGNRCQLVWRKAPLSV